LQLPLELASVVVVDHGHHALGIPVDNANQEKALHKGSNHFVTFDLT